LCCFFVLTKTFSSAFFSSPSNQIYKTNQMQQALDLDELFHDCYFDDLTLPEPVTSSVSAPSVETTTSAAAPPTKRSAEEAGLSDDLPQSGGDSGSDEKGGGTLSSKPAASLTAAQKVERRERNREHAKRSRLRKKFLLESLQDQIEGLQGEIQSLKDIIKRELPDRAEALLKDIDEGDNTNAAGPKKGEYTPLPMPSGFGPVKTLMEPDYRLMSALSGSQQNFAISDPSLPDNPIVYVSQGFLDLTGYTLDQVLGRNCRFLQGPGTDQAAVDVIRKGVREGTDTSVCLLNYKADGTPFWNQFFVAALRDAENNVVNFVGVQCEVSKAVVDKHIAEGKTPFPKK
jgi:PAS domain S-box-containing protein